MLSLLAQITLLSFIARLGFGGEDIAIREHEPEARDNWHHQRLTLEACERAGFAEGPRSASDCVKWHADMIDSYLYNPLWWVEGPGPAGIDRFKVSAATAHELKKLHFDDLTSTAQVHTQWTRYMSGTVAGLMWAAENDDVAAAHNIVGISLHAMQDFYAHSNWVDDPGRRTKTWLQAWGPVAKMPLIYTGAYEHGEQHGIKHHGKVSLACSVLKQGPIDELMTHAAGALSPFQKTSAVQQWKKCSDATPVQPTVKGVKVPKGMVYLDPPGIALDSRWQAPIAHSLRDIPDDITPDELFDAATKLAVETGAQWLAQLEEIMTASGKGQFWQKVKSTSSRGQLDEQFERYNRFPYMFLSAGNYPPAKNDRDSDWYLRVRTITSRDHDSGTNAQIVMRAEGDPRRFPLDYSPDKWPVFDYNDHETGDDIAYVLGPFRQLPTRLTLTNEDKNVGDVLAALGQVFVEAVESVVDAIGEVLLSLIGGHADFVGTSKVVFTPAKLAKIGSTAKPWKRKINGGAEGAYEVHGTCRRISDGHNQTLGDYAEYEVTIDRMWCIRESSVDQTGFDDEPFVIALLSSPSEHTVQKAMSQPAKGVDDKEWVHVGIRFKPVKVPVGSGALVLPFAIWESDDEGAGGRKKILNEFAAKTEQKSASAVKKFLDTLGASLAADWKVQRIEIFAFNRARKGAAAGHVWGHDVNSWLKGGQTWTLDLAREPLAHSWSLPPRFKLPIKGGKISPLDDPGRFPIGGRQKSADPSGNGGKSVKGVKGVKGLKDVKPLKRLPGQRGGGTVLGRTRQPR